MTKEYTISDLFFTGWDELTPMTHAEVFALRKIQLTKDPDSIEYGVYLINILRRLRKNRRLVDQIDETQAVDIFNDLKFLDEPWTWFPVKTLPTRNFMLYAPDDKMATHTFDHFIYADNEFTCFLATQDRKYLARLAATIYRAKGEVYLDKEAVEARADQLGRKLTQWQGDLIFVTFGHIRDFITRRCKTLLPPAGPSPEGEPRIVPTGPMWLKLKHRLAETPAFQGFDNAGRANMYSAIDYLEDLAQRKENK